MESPLMQHVEALAQFIQNFVQTNWSTILSVCIGVFAYRFLKTGLSALVSIIAIGFIISVMTHAGLIPPIQEIFDAVAKAAPTAMNEVIMGG